MFDFLGALPESIDSLDASLDNPHGTAARNTLTTTSRSEQPNTAPVLLKAVKKEVSDDSVDSDSFQNNNTTASKGYTKRSTYGNSVTYAPPSNNMEINDKKLDNMENKDIKSRNCSRISSGIIN